MFGEAASLFMRVFSQVFLWFEAMLTRCGALGPFIAAIFIYQVGRFLLRPIFGSAGSDQARRSKDGDDDE